MDEKADIQAKIEKYRGAINARLHQQADASAPYQQSYPYASSSYRGRARWSPYGRGGSRGGRSQTFQNRTLVVGGTQTPPQGSEGVSSSIASAAQQSPFISTRGYGKNQLVSKDVYEREFKQKADGKERMRVAKRQKVHTDEHSKLMQHIQTTSTTAHREITVDGIRFTLRDDGSKLTRIFDPDTSNREPPKKITIAGVVFRRTTHGNFIRAEAVKDLNRYHYKNAPWRGPDSHPHCFRHNNNKLPQCENFTKHGSVSISSGDGQRATQHSKSPQAGKTPCSVLTFCVGKCPFGPNCNFSHDANKVAICKDFLKTGECSAGEMCDMSHELTYHRVSACTHFLRGNCTNDACRYPHVHVSPSASVCRPFALLGCCDRGDECNKRHVTECPDYSNHGHCKNLEKGQCALPHIDRASTLRKAAARRAKIGAEGESDLSSSEDEEAGTAPDDVDSDEFDMAGFADSGHGGSLTQQDDYISFS